MAPRLLVPARVMRDLAHAQTLFSPVESERKNEGGLRRGRTSP